MNVTIAYIITFCWLISICLTSGFLLLCITCPLYVFLGGSVRMTYRYSIPNVSTLKYQEPQFLPNSPLSSSLPGAMSAGLSMVGISTVLYCSVMGDGYLLCSVILFLQWVLQLFHINFQVFKSAFRKQKMQLEFTAKLRKCISPQWVTIFSTYLKAGVSVFQDVVAQFFAWLCFLFFIFPHSLFSS